MISRTCKSRKFRGRGVRVRVRVRVRASKFRKFRRHWDLVLEGVVWVIEVRHDEAEHQEVDFDLAPVLRSG